MAHKNLGAGSLFLLSVCLLSSAPASSATERSRAPSLNMMGQLGLNTIPSARSLPEGTFHTGLSRTAPYTHAFAGLQITNRLYIGLRQSSESARFNSDTLHLYPGIDMKYRLYNESRYVPKISVGLQSALGHKRFSAEYLVLSKRYENFDLTFGFGWGRMASRMSLPNPVLFNAFQNKSYRAADGENPNSPADWFKGDMGLFGGFEYATPVDGLSFKADWNSDAWTAEHDANPDFKAPAPWSVGLSYRPVDWLDAGVAYAGGESIMARLSVTPDMVAWPLKPANRYGSIRMNPDRNDHPAAPFDDNENNDDTDEFTDTLTTEDRLGLSHILISNDRADADLALHENLSTPHQIGEAARYLSNIAGHTPEEIRLHLRMTGLQGTDINLNRMDLERAMRRHHGSSEEIWQTTGFHADTSSSAFARILPEIGTAKSVMGFKFDLVNDVSLSEDDSGLLYRTGGRISLAQFFGRHFLSFQSLRLNIADNLQKLNELRPVSASPVRGDIDLFTRHGLLIDREFVGVTLSPAHDVHIGGTFGYLEEMYMGLAGEILYRPFGKNWAIGAEAALTTKRDPLTFSALAPTGDRFLSGFINGYYEIPATGSTVKASIGRFLGGDVGGTISLTNELSGGAQLSATLSASNYYDPDIYGDKTNVYTGLRLSLPLGSLPFIPDGSQFIMNAAPFGRDTAQRLDNPASLYDMTEPLSYRHITRHWGDVMLKK